jgi:hypothetical protein
MPVIGGLHMLHGLSEAMPEGAKTALRNGVAAAGRAFSLPSSPSGYVAARHAANGSAAPTPYLGADRCVCSPLSGIFA